ncbi:MAG TPA: oligoendopeptidase F [Pirellulales bacterium]|jgi:oligoendopeptidase F|nr:oligoendopeptidase F [Pirellulales bacterium]
MPAATLPDRAQVAAADTWDLSSLYADDNAWEQAFVAWEKQIDGLGKYQGRLAESAAMLAACLKQELDFDRIAERLSNYAFLKTAEDTANSSYQRMLGRYRNAASRASQASSYIRPEILAIPAATMTAWLDSPELKPYRLWLERIVRYRPHTLSEKEERLLAMQSEMSGAADRIFRQLNNADLKFGIIENERGETVELTHSSFSALLHSPNRDVRRRAFRQYYLPFKGHENTLAATLSGSVDRDVYYAKARNYASAFEAALFPDRVPPSVYTNLIDSVHRHLPALYHYYDLRRRKMNLPDIHHYDTYVPILSELESRHTWDEGVATVIDALEPLGDEYCRVLDAGLRGRWCDRYENRGKQSGAFSSGSYDALPYILMNYQSDVLDHVFTLAHEAGHSMHSHYSAHRQPFQYYDYTIFVAEVASTFNEQLLSKHLLKHAASDAERAFLINREIDAIRGTIIRQTMFAEFEKLTHELAERHEPLTLEAFTTIYRGLLELYFGPQFTLDDELRLECFRIPHFYRAFYVYKYATGLSAAIALAERVTTGGQRELDDYLNFLGGGCSKDPLDLLRGAGVDMETPEPVDQALARFTHLVDELDALLV